MSAARATAQRSAALQFGDVLPVQGPWSDVLGLKAHRKDFIVMGQPDAIDRRSVVLIAGKISMRVTLLRPSALELSAQECHHVIEAAECLPSRIRLSFLYAEAPD